MSYGYWDYYPHAFSRKLFAPLYLELSQSCENYQVATMRGNFPSKRISCVVGNGQFNDARSNYFNYNNLPAYTWDQLPILNKIKTKVEKKLNTTYDYCLCHIYRTGKDSLGYHSDKEALDSDVASLSFGATRKFRFRKVGKTSGYEVEYELKNGDLLHMLPGCQRKYSHSVPSQATVTEPRINLTFRKLEIQKHICNHNENKCDK